MFIIRSGNVSLMSYMCKAEIIRPNIINIHLNMGASSFEDDIRNKQGFPFELLLSL